MIIKLHYIADKIYQVYRLISQLIKTRSLVELSMRSLLKLLILNISVNPNDWTKISDYRVIPLDLIKLYLIYVMYNSSTLLEFHKIYSAVLIAVDSNYSTKYYLQVELVYNKYRENIQNYFSTQESIITK